MSLQTRLSDLITSIGTDIKTLNTSVAQAAKRAVLVPDADATVDEASSVVWKRASDGAYVAYETVQEIPSAPNRAYSKSDVVDSEGTGYAQQALRARGLVSGNRRAASILLAGSPTSRYVRALAETDSGGVHSMLAIDSTGKSSFIQDGPGIDRRLRTWGPYSFGVTVNAGASLNIDWNVPVELRPISQFTSFFVDLEMVGISTGGFFEQIGVARADTVLNPGAANEALRWWFHQFAGSQGQGTMKFWIRTIGP